MKIVIILVIFWNISLSFAADSKLQNFIYIGGSEAKEVESKLTDNIEGVQIIYSWKRLEADENQYTFDKIENDLVYLTSKNKKLWIQVQDRSFSPEEKSVPQYLLTNPKYNGGSAKQTDQPGEGLAPGQGWVAKQWNPNVRRRFQNLLEHLALEFDGKVYGINLPETSADIDEQAEAKDGFSCNKYFNGTIENIKFARKVFKKSYVVQYSNFWPCEWNNDHQYMSRLFEMAEKSNIGLGGPDVVPYQKGQMKNSYPFFNKYKGKLAMTAFAVQEATRTYTNPKTGNKFTDKEFLEFAQDFLGANIVFWSIE